MSYHYYGGTRETSIERDMADLKWLKKHGSKKALSRLAKQDRLITISAIALSVLVLVGLGALLIWGFRNIFESGFNWQVLLFNPVTFVVLMVGWGITSLNKA